MRKMDQAALKARLEALCGQWAALGQGEEGRRQALQGEIFELVFRLFPGRGDHIATVFLQDWRSFDPAKGSAYKFFANRIKNREKTTWDKQEKYQERTVGGAMETDDGESFDLVENIPARSDSGPEEQLQLDETACALLAAMLELPQRLHGQANNPVRRGYFRLFFTGGVADYLHSAPLAEGIEKRERDLFSAMKVEFLDYFMARRCRALWEICRSPLKPYGQVVEGGSMEEETRLPLPNDVYCAYMDRVEGTPVGASAVANQRSAYKDFLRATLSVEE